MLGEFPHMQRTMLRLTAVLLLALGAFAADGPLADTDIPASSTLPAHSAAVSPAPLSPEAALASYENSVAMQERTLSAYSALTIIHAELPQSARAAEYKLRRHYAAPGSLEFDRVASSGDSFVKSNVIARLLQAEVDHVRRHEQPATAITSANYRFHFKRRDGGAYVYDVKPRRKNAGLFKGEISLSSSTGQLLAAGGRLVKSPSFIIRRIDFQEDYAQVEGFTFPVRIHSEAETRIVGRAVVDVVHSDYRPQSAGGEVEVASVNGAQ
jgi:hypothetical protein